MAVLSTLKESLFGVCAIFCLLSCQRNRKDELLPVATHIGADVIACKINGQIYVANGKPSGKGGPFQTLGVWYAGPINGGQYWIASRHDLRIVLNEYQMYYPHFELGKGSYATYQNAEDGTIYGTDSLHLGSVQITFQDSTILAGNFSFDAANDDDAEVHITDGWFDLSR